MTLVISQHQGSNAMLARLLAASTNSPRPVFLIEREPDWGAMNRLLTTWDRFDDFDRHDPLDPRAVRRRYQENLAKLRGREPAFVHRGIGKTGSRAARRRGARSREQRTR